MVVAFLQNQWFRPESVKTVERIYANHGHTPEGRADLNARFLFMGCLTGRRLKAAFGELCDTIIWEEISREVGSKSSSSFKADPVHIRNVVEHFKPTVILAFGKLAEEAMVHLPWEAEFCFERDKMARVATKPTLILAPHPAARHKSVCYELSVACQHLKSLGIFPNAQAA